MTIDWFDLNSSHSLPFGATTFCTMAFTLMTLRLSHSTEYIHRVSLLKFSLCELSLCWFGLCCILKCLVSLRQMPLCWLSWRPVLCQAILKHTWTFVSFCDMDMSIFYYLYIVFQRAPGAVFTTLYFLHNLIMRPISYSVTLHYAGKASRDKHASFLGQFVSYEENEVLLIQLQGPYLQHFNFFITYERAKSASVCS